MRFIEGNTGQGEIEVFFPSSASVYAVTHWRVRWTVKGEAWDSGGISAEVPVDETDYLTITGLEQ